MVYFVLYRFIYGVDFPKTPKNQLLILDSID